MMLNVTSNKLPNRNIRVLTNLELLMVSGGRGMSRGSHRTRSQAGNGGFLPVVQLGSRCNCKVFAFQPLVIQAVFPQQLR